MQEIARDEVRREEQLTQNSSESLFYHIQPLISTLTAASDERVSLVLVWTGALGLVAQNHAVCAHAAVVLVRRTLTRLLGALLLLDALLVLVHDVAVLAEAVLGAHLLPTVVLAVLVQTGLGALLAYLEYLVLTAFDR